MSTDPAMAMSLNARVFIIGCGISGIAAAQRLINAGFGHVRILEATARSGGRIKTSRLGNNIAELGAKWLHGPSEANPVFCLARKYGLLNPEDITPEKQAMEVGEMCSFVTSAFSSSGQKLSTEDFYPAQEMAVELLYESVELWRERGERWSCLGDLLRSEARQRAAERWKDIDATARSLRLSVISNILKGDGLNLDQSIEEMDLEGYSSIYKNLPGLDCTFTGGYETLIKSLMSELPGGLVSYNQPVCCVHWNNTEKRETPVMIECYDGERLAADHVIVTVPLGHLKKNHSALFHPPLPPHKLHSIQTIGFGTKNKIFVEFDSPWWDADCDAVFLVWEDEDVMVDQVPDVLRSWIKKLVAFTVVKPTERCGHVLCGWIAGPEAQYMETLSEQEVTSTITQVIRRFTGNPTITARRVLRTQWFHDPWTCGSYTILTRDCKAQDLENMMEPLPMEGSQSQPLQVLFAGESTHLDYYGTVHGAFLSGLREADRLISHYSSVSPDQNI